MAGAAGELTREGFSILWLAGAGGQAPLAQRLRRSLRRACPVRAPSAARAEPRVIPFLPSRAWTWARLFAGRQRIELLVESPVGTHGRRGTGAGARNALRFRRYHEPLCDRRECLRRSSPVSGRKKKQPRSEVATGLSPASLLRPGGEAGGVETLEALR